MTHWHYAQLELVPDDLMIAPTISPPVDTRAEARAEIQGLLDRLMIRVPAVAKLAKKWREDNVKDDWLFWEVFNWTIIECEGSCRESAQRLLEEHADSLRAAGLRWVQVPALPENWPNA
ncbi:hypothetical protein [Glycomyces sp. NPDC021274]|uniref:hypothetical protein n=1 Tax=Glycomyces sp. NPDC021274 TaxID=3155120 RepID=UPI0034041F5C